MLFDTETSKHKSFTLPGSTPHYNPDRPGQVEHIFLDLTLNISQQMLQGICTITLNPIRNDIKFLTLDGVNLNIQSITINHINQPFTYNGEKIQINLINPTEENHKINIAIAYSVQNPEKGIYFISPNSYYPNKPHQIWTQGEDEDSRYWFPCFDYPGQLSTSEIRVKVPQPFLAISNGLLIATETIENHTIYHWYQKEIHPTYLITLAVGDFAEIKDQWRDIPVNYYVEKGREEEGLRSMGKTPKMIEFFSNTFGYDYPYPKYAQVCVTDFTFGGMENTSTTLLTDRCLLDARASLDNRNTESLVAHELAHQWFGDLVVIKHWSHAWIKEGMATYSEVLWTEYEYGKDDAAYYIWGERNSYLSEDKGRYRRPIVTHIYREPIELYDRHLYEKGACVYHIIHRELGTDLFLKVLQTFLKNYAHQTVETIDLIRTIENTTGRNLLYLFDQYVFRGGHPDYKVNYEWDNQSNLAKVTVTQTQAKNNQSLDDLFDLKIPIGFGYKEQNPIIFNVRVYQQEQSFFFPLEKQPDYISFDVGNAILKTVELDYPLPELKSQLEYDPDPVSRIYAAESLAKKGGLEALKALGKALTDDPFWGVRVEVAQQITKVKLDHNFNVLIIGLQDKDARVRKAIVEGLGNIKTYASYEQIKEIVQLGDESYNVEATAIRVLGGMSSIDYDDDELQAEIWDLLQDVLKNRGGWNEVVRCGAIAALAQLRNHPLTVPILNDYTEMREPQPLRLAAIRGLGEISKHEKQNNQEWILEQLEYLAKETFFLTQIAVVNALTKVPNTRAIGILSSIAEQTKDGRIKRLAEEGIQTVQKNVGNEPAIKQLREDLEELKKENQELRTRLENLEAKNN